MRGGRLDLGGVLRRPKSMGYPKRQSGLVFYQPTLFFADRRNVSVQPRFASLRLRYDTDEARGGYPAAVPAQAQCSACTWIVSVRRQKAAVPPSKAQCVVYTPRCRGALIGTDRTTLAPGATLFGK